MRCIRTLKRESMSLWVKRLSGLKLVGSSSTNSPPVATCALHDHDDMCMLHMCADADLQTFLS